MKNGKSKHILVYGIGNISDRHRKNLKKILPNSVIIAVSSSGRNPKKKPENCDKFFQQCPFDQLPNFDLAIIASPATFHLEHARIFISAGIPTFIEKPLSASSEDALELLHLQKTFKTPVFVDYCLRYHEVIVKLKNIVESGLLGKIFNIEINVGQYLPSWRENKNFNDSVSVSSFLGGGVLLELSHELDYCNWIFGETTLIHSSIRNLNELGIEVEEVADLFFINKKNQLISIHMDFLQKKPTRFCNLITEKGNLYCDIIGKKIELHNENSIEILYSNSSYDTNDMYISILKDFIESSESRNETLPTVIESLKVVELIEKIKHKNG